jgi:hypothetical protein
MVAGLLIGYLLMMLFSEYNWAYFQEVFRGLITGYFMAAERQKDKNAKKMLM